MTKEYITHKKRWWYSKLLSISWELLLHLHLDFLCEGIHSAPSSIVCLCVGRGVHLLWAHVAQDYHPRALTLKLMLLLLLLLLLMLTIFIEQILIWLRRVNSPLILLNRAVIFPSYIVFKLIVGRRIIDSLNLRRLLLLHLQECSKLVRWGLGGAARVWASKNARRVPPVYHRRIP